MNFISRTLHRFHEREWYAIRAREPFYDLAGSYLPDNPEAVVIDVGCGYADFAKRLDLWSRYTNLMLLDGNASTVKKVQNARLYKAPDELPFSRESVEYIHCSHMIEHLRYEELYKFLTEVDRVLAPGGIFVVSAPLLWKRFFHNLTHVAPYGPEVLLNYLARGDKDTSATADPAAGVISYSYKKEELIFRYRKELLLDEVGSSVFVLDFLVRLLSRALWSIGCARYVQNGYTIILRKAP